MEKHRGIWSSLQILTAIVAIIAMSQDCFALGIGSGLSSNKAQWEWGSDYIPEGRTPVRFTVNAFSYDLDYISVLWPFVETSGGDWLDCTLVEVNGQPVSQVEPYYAMPPRSYDFTWDITPKAGYAWPTQSFQLMAGAYGTSGPDAPSGGIGGYPAVGAGYKFNSPSSHFSYLQDGFGQFTHKQELGDRRGGWEAWTFPGRAPNNAIPSYYDLTPGVWVKEGDTVVFNADGTFEVGAFGDPIYLDGDGTDDYESYRYLSDVPTGALIAGVFTEMSHESVELFTSEGNPDGFIGAGRNDFIAPATGLLAFRVNLLTYDEGARGIKLDSDYTVDIMVPEPATLSILAVGGLILAKRRRR